MESIRLFVSACLRINQVTLWTRSRLGAPRVDATCWDWDVKRVVGGGGEEATANQFTMKNTGFYFRWQLHQAVLSWQHNKGTSFPHRTLHPVRNKTPQEIKYFKTVNK